MVVYLHILTMNNGDTHELYYVDRMLDIRNLSEERWFSYKDGKEKKMRYINIAQISDIYITAMKPAFEKVI